MPVYDPATGTGRMLALDLDPGRLVRDVDDGAVEHSHKHGAGRAAKVRAQAEVLGGLVSRCGGRVLADVSPSGGRHVYVLFAAPLPWRELRDLCRAIAVRFPAVDPAPMASLGGQLSPPGSRHKSGGWRVLSIPAAAALAAVGHPNGAEVWAAVLAEFAAELQRADPRDGERRGDNRLFADLDDTGVPWAPCPGGRAVLSAELDHMARTGRWDRSRYAGRSEARMAVLAAAAARGWRLADVRSAISSGAWPGLPALYERRSEPGRLDRLLPAEWRKAVAFVTGEKNLRGWPTSDHVSRPPAPIDGVDEFGLIRRWMTAVDCAVADPERVRGWGGRGIAVRLVLAALGQAAMVSGSAVVEFGVRNLSLHSALSSRTVARVLRLLSDEPDPLIDLVSPRRLARADIYQLRIPDRYTASVRWRRRRAGRIAAIHPAFLVLGSTAALTYQVLDSTGARGAEVARAARLSPSAASAALRVLAGHGLAERGPGGWRRGPADLDAVAEATGAADIHRERAERYRQERASWRARLRRYACAPAIAVTPRDGWLDLDDEDDWAAMLASRWPVLSDEFVRGPPRPADRETA